MLLGALLLASTVQAGKLSIVIDDMGYLPREDHAILQMPVAISVAILPNSPHAHQIATQAHNQGREILIHIPMAPLSKQSLERDTLQPSMSSEEVQRIIRDAVNNVPYAVGINNHMGSAMTSSLPGMQKVMQALAGYQLYFLDSMTIGNSQATRAATGTGITVIKRKVFLDDSANPNDIRQQFNRAVDVARRHGSAIAIGHPRPATIKVLQQMLPTLPGDIVLVKPSALLNEPQQSHGSDTPQRQPHILTPKSPFSGTIKQCKVKLPKQGVNTGDALKVIGEGVAQSPIVVLIKRHWQNWAGSTQNLQNQQD
ncbi:divergent polysaccharide deacetylase family protein [Serratia sp. DD3]|uniref:divergent polysaccharide deacetylase family protein n=1 Tax=Serratia sp. DD3 TaxID=1410619 RepID=UPI0003C4E3B2|nr:divergent polysaccharide deacetylase family protein [Serratia sp. DD3]KEY56503.1 divergent polysaccharide deacetylase [Serratia sp. DD3]KEY56723.1 divergent polysaccharide deacetylase [Serratia sp. DD3]KEY58344.1 divergent polysaccharide deacetylase [Serratia sp. DD3]KEY59434.1 divergent polysaccharide deacetylase [Serratia sp. DD3]